MRNRRERGEGQFGCLVGLAILVIAGLVAYRMIPVKVKAADLRDTITDDAKSAGRMNDKAITQDIINKAEQLELPVTEENIEIKRREGYIRVDVNYTVPVKFPGYTYQWKFSHTAENPVF